MCRSLVDGDSVGWDSTVRGHQTVRADLEGQVRRVLHALRSEPDARRARSGAAVAVYRRAADGRSDASADDSCDGSLRRGVAEAGRRADSIGHSLEVRLQGREVDRPHPLRRAATAQYVAGIGAAGVWVLLERESER